MNFPDQQAPLDADLIEAMDPMSLVRELRSITIDQPLAARLIDAVTAIRAYFDRQQTLLGSLPPDYIRRRRRTGSLPSASEVRGRGQHVPFLEPVVALLEPDRAALRQPVDSLAALFVMLLIGSGRQPPITAEDLIDLFLHGALRP